MIMKTANLVIDNIRETAGHLDAENNVLGIDSMEHSVVDSLVPPSTHEVTPGTPERDISIKSRWVWDNTFFFLC